MLKYKKFYIVFLVGIVTYIIGSVMFNMYFKVDYNIIEDIGQICNFDNDCNTPFEYMVKSDCPYTSKCIQKSCNVVCPLPFEGEKIEEKTLIIEKDYIIEYISEQECTEDSECETPVDYLMMSRCQFKSKCIENKCSVICPINLN